MHGVMRAITQTSIGLSGQIKVWNVNAAIPHPTANPTIAPDHRRLIRPNQGWPFAPFAPMKSKAP